MDRSMSNLEAAQAYINAWNNRDADAILASLTPDGTYEDPATTAPITGEAIRSYVSGLWSSYPDLSFEVKSCGATGEHAVAVEWVMRGTNTGSAMGLPPTGKTIMVNGADFFRIKDGKVSAVTGYFDKSEVPRQLGLAVIVQPKQIGPFRFGVSTMVQTGKTEEPVAFSITSLEAKDDDAVQVVRAGARASLIDMLKMDGFIGATTAAIGHRMVTISAWNSPDASRQVMKQGAHAEAQKGMYDGTVAKHGFTSVWTKHRMNPEQVLCNSCHKMSRGPGEDRMCSCGAKLPDKAPYW
jgi:steroid delta-isomerase-like uncharacterized protein